MIADRRKRGRRPQGFIERTLASFASAAERGLVAEDRARECGLLQRVDPRAKLLGLLALIVAAAAAHRLWIVAALFAVAIIMAELSRVTMRELAKRVWLAVLVFTGLIALPTPFLTPGRTLWSLPWLGWPVTAQGLTSAAYLVMRAETAATFAALLVFSTPWSRVLKALRVLRTPDVLVAVLGMTYRYLFLFLETAKDMFESRRSRIIGRLSGTERRRVAAASAGVLLSKSLQLSSEVYDAMQARGFRGEIYLLDEFEGPPRDWTTWIMAAIFAVLAAAAFWLGW